jgi:acyl-CoA synthetase (AMP-forming)/AMP-acid ligase II
VSGDGVLLDLLAGPAAAPALRTPEDGEPLSYGALDAVVVDLAGRLRALGVERGDRVAFALPPGPELVELLLAISALGAAAAPLNPAYAEPEFAFYLEDLAPRALLLPAGALEPARRAAGTQVVVADIASAPRATPTVAVGGREVAAAPLDSVPDAGDVALLLHTSGTTSRPKQVPLRHRNLVASARSIAAHYRLSADDVSYCAMPLFHVHGLVASCLAQLAAGGTVVVPRRVASGRFWGQLAEHGVTWYSASPAFHAMLLERAPAEPPRDTRLRFVRSCSSPLAPERQAAMEEYLAVPVLQAYGMTEASHEMAANPLPPARRKAGSVGIGTGSEVRVVDPTGVPVADGEQGEVVVRGPCVMDGYLGNEQATRDAFHGDWFRTGDLGVQTDGYLRLIGRIKEFVDRGGEKISPAEVEEAILRHPAVADAVVYGIPDPKYGQVVGSAVVLRDDVEVDALLAHCHEQVAAYKVPTVVHVVDRIPRTPTGKLQRPRMAEHFGEG